MGSGCKRCLMSPATMQNSLDVLKLRRVTVADRPHFGMVVIRAHVVGKSAATCVPLLLP